MKLNRRTFAFLMAGALSLCAADAFGGIRPLPPGAQPYPGWAWCPRCEGRRHVPSGFLGWTSKPCPNCRGTGMIQLPPPPPPPPPAPKPAMHHRKPHHQPAPAAHHQPQPQHHQPTPQYGHPQQPGPGAQYNQQRPGQPPRR